MQPQAHTDENNPTPPRGIAVTPQAQPGMPTYHRPQPVIRKDDSTRFLCAAAHLDAEFAEGAIREFLLEPTRAVAPSPGIDARQVLEQAVAARRRHRLRDGLLCALAPLALVSLLLSGDSLLLGVGLLGGLLLGMLAAFLRRGEVPQALAGLLGRARGERGALRLLLAFFGAAYLIYMLVEVATVGFLAPLQVVGVVLLLIMLLVLVVDEINLWSLVTNRFRATTESGGPSAGQQAATSGRFTTGLDQYRPETRQQREESESTPVTVYRGYHPFVGAGQEFQPWSLAIPLQYKESEDGGLEGPRGGLTTDVLYHSVREEIAKLKRATPLSPGRRLADLRILDQVVVPAEELVDHYLAGNEQARQYLPRLDGPPARFVRREQADRVAAHSEEWARYYLCLQLETWDRELVVSIFIHFAMDDETLYIEWTPCVLLPIKSEYRRIDGWPQSRFIPVTQALGEWMTLPASILRRMGEVFSSLRRIPQDRVRVNPDRYGALRSLREMAADNEAQNYFQLLDVERYRKIVQSRFNLTVGRILDEHGYSSQLFRSQAATMITNNFLGGNFAGPIVTGGTVGTAAGGTVAGGTVAADPNSEH